MLSAAIVQNSGTKGPLPGLRRRQLVEEAKAWSVDGVVWSVSESKAVESESSS